MRRRRRSHELDPPRVGRAGSRASRGTGPAPRRAAGVSVPAGARGADSPARAIERRIEAEVPGRATRVELRLRANLRVAHVRLVERVDADRRARDGRGELPAEELGAEIGCRAGVMRSTGRRARSSGSAQRAFVRRRRASATATNARSLAYSLHRPERLVDDGQHAASVLAGALGDELLDPGAKRPPRGGQAAASACRVRRARARP